MSRPVSTAALIFCLTAFVGIASAAQVSNICALPGGLKTQISAKYPDARLLTMTDLREYDRKLFEKDHGPQCPGLVRVNFYGDGKPTYALVLLSGEQQESSAHLLVARRLGNSWEISSLDKASKAVPVVWHEKPGNYRDVYGEKTIRAVNETIVFCEYESWAILYAWTGKDVKKIWIAD